VDHFVEYFSNPSDTVTGGIVSAFQGGAAAGTIFNMAFANTLGRKKTIFLGSAVSVMGSALQAGAAAMSMLIIGRFIGGFAVGILTSTIPMFAAEISPAKYRGLQSGLLQWFLSWGFLVAQWLGFGFEKINGPIQWRFPLAFQCLPALILLFGIFFLQESPRWLVERDRHDEAKKVLQKLRSNGTLEQDKFVALELKEIVDVVAADRLHNQTSWKTIFTKASWRKRLILGCGVQAFGPLSGISESLHHISSKL
jgi:MFS family permease